MSDTNEHHDDEDEEFFDDSHENTFSDFGEI
jgi:hypothetical protein